VRQAVLAAAVLAMLLVAGCTSIPGEQRREAWRLERPPLTQMGQPATFQFNANPWHLMGEMDIPLLAAPLAFMPVADGDQGNWMFFREARIPGHAAGVLVVQGARIEMQAGSIAGLRIDAAHGGSALHFEPVPQVPVPLPTTIDLPGAYDDAERAFRGAEFVAAPVSGVSLTGYDRALLWTPDEATAFEEVPPFSAAGWRWVEGSRLQPGPGTYQGSTDHFALGGSLRGTLVTETAGTIPDPGIVTGNIATLSMEPARVWTEQPFRLSQVIRSDRPLVAATIETDPIEPFIILSKGQTGWVTVNFRERGHAGDAVLRDVQVTGSGADNVVIPAMSHWQEERLWQTVQQTTPAAPWMAPFTRVPIRLVSPYVPVADAAQCTFGDCPQTHPYPVWMAVGEVGVFYVRVHAGQSTGDFDVTIWLNGHNFETETFTFQYKVQ
jgi:hypothetical protein